jgi:hypothetical protein
LPQNYAVIMNALQKVYGGRRRVPPPELYALIGEIMKLRLNAKIQGSSGNRPFQGQEKDLRASAAKGLLDIAISSTTELRRLADALDAIEAGGGPDARQMNIVKAYIDCDNYPPTLRELREKFIARFGQRCWPTDFSVRKTLAWLELPLAKGKRGRPRGSRSLISNPRR